MENYYIRNFEKLWNIDSTIIREIDDFETILKILSSGKLKNDIVWKVMHDWMSVDTFNRLEHFKQFFKKCFQLDYQSRQFVKNEVFSSEIFRLLPIKFQTELEEFAEKVLQPPYTELSETANVIEHTFRSPEKNDKFPQQLSVIESISLPKTVAHFVSKNAKQLLVCFDSENVSVQFYDIKHKSWHSSPVSLPLPVTQDIFQLALLGSMLYAFGGCDNDRNSTNLMWSRDLSDPSFQWTARAVMKKSRKWFASVVLNDTIYVLGGKDNDYDYLRSCERYSSQLNEWSKVADMNSGRGVASAAVINGCIYVAGGYDGYDGKRVLKSVEKYCPETDTDWREVAPMTTDRKGFALTPFADRLWAIGGVDDNFNTLSSCESYDPVTDTWREEAPMKEGKWAHAAMEFNGELYVVGGKRKNNSTVVEKYVPTIGWVEDSQLRKICYDPQLLIIPPAFTSFFTTDQPDPAVQNNKKSTCKVS